MKIIDFQKKYFSQVIDVFTNSIKNTCIKDYNEEQILAWVDIDSLLIETRLENQKTWLAIDNDNVVGFISINNTGYLDLLFVLPRYQGNHIATSLLWEVEQYCQHRGINNILTESSLTAKSFFEKNGFILKQTQNVYVRRQYFVNFQMEKRIT